LKGSKKFNQQFLVFDAIQICCFANKRIHIGIDELFQYLIKIKSIKNKEIL